MTTERIIPISDTCFAPPNPVSAVWQEDTLVIGTANWLLETLVAEIKSGKFHHVVYTNDQIPTPNHHQTDVIEIPTTSNPHTINIETVQENALITVRQQLKCYFESRRAWLGMLAVSNASFRLRRERGKDGEQFFFSFEHDNQLLTWKH